MLKICIILADILLYELIDILEKFGGILPSLSEHNKESVNIFQSEPEIPICMKKGNDRGNAEVPSLQ